MLFSSHSIAICRICKNRDFIWGKQAGSFVPYKSVIIVKSGVRKLYARVTEQEHELSR